MNILDRLSGLLPEAYLGIMPDAPDGCAALFEYAVPPEQSYGSTDDIYGVQLRARDTTADAAYARAEAADAILNHYHDGAVSILRTTSILGIGVDGASPPRHEYTINYTVRRC